MSILPKISPNVVDSLEPRRMLAATLSTDGVLAVTGTANNDVIVITADPANPARLKVSDRGVVTRFTLAAVRLITVEAFRGNDRIQIGETLPIPTSINGAGGVDSLTGGAGKDTLNGGEADDLIDGRANNDLLIGGIGSDEIIGGPGKDTVSYEYVTVTFPGSGRAENGAIVSLDGLKNDQEAGVIEFVDPTVENIIGSQFRDDLIGNGGANVISGGGGGDFIVGHGGDDSLIGGKGADTLRGGSGNDTLDGGDGADQLLGESGIDVLLGGSANDTLEGGAGIDQITGGGGADTFLTTERDAGEVLDFTDGVDLLA